MLWVPLKVAAARVEVHPRTMKRWCLAGQIRATRLAGTGPWRIAMTTEGELVPTIAPPAVRSMESALAALAAS